MYEAAFQICEDKGMLKAYLYACRRYMNGETYAQLLRKSQMYADMDLELTEEIKEIADKVQVLQYEDTMENWRSQYRRISTGEI